MSVFRDDEIGLCCDGAICELIVVRVGGDEAEVERRLDVRMLR